MPSSIPDHRVNDEPHDSPTKRVNMGSSSRWTPSIWNALTFWKNSATLDEEGAENHQGDASAEFEASDRGHGLNVPSGTNDDIGDVDMGHSNEGISSDSSFASNLSEEQVSMHLLQPQRHVHFRLPASDQQDEDYAQQFTPTTPVGQNSPGNYVAPTPPSSLRDSSSSHQDPFTEAAEYLANAARDGRSLTHIETLGLNTLMQQSISRMSKVPALRTGLTSQVETGRPTAAQSNRQHHPFSSMPGSTTSSPSAQSSIPPTFTNPNSDFAALLVPSPSYNANTLSTTTAAEASPRRSSASPTRTLTRNPNGTLYYAGGGSARFRSRSPSSSPSSPRKKAAFPRGFGESPKVNGSPNPAGSPSQSDNKRRRIGEERETSTVQPSGSTSVTNGANDITGTAAASLRFGVSSSGARLWANTPTRPSPLRQSMRADSSSPSTASPGSVNGESSRKKDSDVDNSSRTRASERASQIMAGIINDATPKKDSARDIRNPYQTNSRGPTRRVRKPPATNAPRPLPRPSRTAAPPEPPPTKKLSALETINRTAPPPQIGSKRSRSDIPATKPSAENGLRTRPEQPGSSPDKPLLIESDDEDEDSKQPPMKKQRQDVQEKVRRTGLVVEIEDIEMDGSTTTTEKIARPSEVVEPEEERGSSTESKRQVFAETFPKKAPTARFQRMPKEPSPLRQSFQPDTSSSPPKDNASLLQKPSPTVSLFGQPSMPAPSGSQSAAPTLLKDVSYASDTPSLPKMHPFGSISFGQVPSPPSMPNASVAVAVPSLKDTQATSTAFSEQKQAPSNWLLVAKTDALVKPVGALPTFVFKSKSGAPIRDGYKYQRDAALAAPEHELPRFNFKVGITSKIEIKASLNTAIAPKSEIKPFDFKAAGMKPIVSSGWTCGTCLVSNSKDATKCISCESPR